MKKATLKIDGMMCPMCEAHVNEAIRELIPGCKVSSSHKDSQSVVIADSIDSDALKAAIEATGYSVMGIEVCEYEKKCFLAKLFKK